MPARFGKRQQHAGMIEHRRGHRRLAVRVLKADSKQSLPSCRPVQFVRFGNQMRLHLAVKPVAVQQAVDHLFQCPVYGGSQQCRRSRAVTRISVRYHQLVAAGHAVE